MYKLMIFDLDGTIVDSVESLAYTVNKCLDVYNLPKAPVEKFYYYAGDGAREMLERAFLGAGAGSDINYDEVFNLYVKLFRDGCLHNVKSFDGLTDTLKRIKFKGVKIAVCTNKEHNNAISVVETVYGKDFFDYILGRQDSIPRKPSPEGALKIAEHFRVMPNECIYVGDTNTDMQTGQNAKMYTVGVTWGFRSKEELENTGANIIITKPSQLENLV